MKWNSLCFGLQSENTLTTSWIFAHTICNMDFLSGLYLIVHEHVAYCSVSPAFVHAAVPHRLYCSFVRTWLTSFPAGVQNEPLSVGVTALRRPGGGSAEEAVSKLCWWATINTSLKRSCLRPRFLFFYLVASQQKPRLRLRGLLCTVCVHTSPTSNMRRRTNSLKHCLITLLISLGKWN